MNGNFVGTWNTHPNKGETLQYDNNWVNSPQGRPLSLSLAFRPGNPPHHGNAVHNYFDNLLPDSKAIRERVARRFKLGSTQAFNLLTEIGRDCAGALQILPTDTPPDDIKKVDATPLSDAEVANLLRNTTSDISPVHQSQDDSDFRLSIAGAQEKTALLRMDEKWYLPHHATPTTHILKLPLGLVGNLKFDMRNSVENEWLCAEIFKAYGLPVANTQILQFEDQKVLAVERFDRRWHVDSKGKRWLIRIPQEDMCQATATPSHLKYESDGGPGMRTIMNLLTTSVDAERDLRTFFQAQVLFWMLRASDGHAKNFSIFLRPGSAYELTPLYDVLSAYPVIGTGANQLSPFKVKMAMAVRSKNPHWTMKSITRRHWLAVGAEHGVMTRDGRGPRDVIDELVEQTPKVVDAVTALLPAGFPSDLADSVLNELVSAVSQLAA